MIDLVRLRSVVDNRLLANLEEPVPGLENLREPVHVAEHQHEQERALEPVQLLVKRLLVEPVAEPVEDDHRVVDHPQPRVERGHRHETHVLDCCKPEVCCDLADVKRDIHDIVEEHHAEPDHLDVQDHADSDHAERCAVVHDQHLRVGRRPQVAEVDDVVGGEEHVIELLEVCHDARRRLLEHVLAIERVEVAVAVRAAGERENAEGRGRRVVDQVERAVHELDREFGFDELRDLLEDDVSHEDAVRGGRDDNRGEHREVAPCERT